MSRSDGWTTEGTADLAVHLQRSLTTLLGEPSVPDSHPAWTYLRQLERLQDGVEVDKAWCSSVTQALLDRATWATYAPDEVWVAYGGSAAMAQLQPRFRDPGQYFDVLAEFRLCGQIRQTARLRAEFEFEASRPDLYLRNGDTKVWIEVKHLRTGSRDERLAEIARKASRQIKNATAGTGAGAMHVSVGDPIEWTDEAEDPAINYTDALERRILVAGRNRSVAQAVISWDDYIALQGSNGTFVLVPRRRARIVTHPEPREPAVIPDEYLTVGRVNPLVTPPLKPIRGPFPSRVSPHRSLSRKLRRHGLSWRGIANSLRNPLVAEMFTIASTTALLMVCSIRRGYVRDQALVGGVFSSQVATIRWIYLLPPDLSLDANKVLKKSPMSVLFDFVGQYGLDLRVDDQLAPLIVAAHFTDRNPEDGRHDISTIRGASAYVDQLGSRETTHVVLQHAIDIARYEQALASSGLAAPPR